MTEQEFLQRFGLLNEADVAGVQKLAQDISKDSREAPDAIIFEWARGADPKAAVIGRDLQETALPAMQASVGRIPPSLRIEFLKRIVDLDLQARAALAEMITGLLKDQSPVAGANVRICDGAYLLARRLTSRLMPPSPDWLPESQFMQLAPAARDREIRKWRSSPAWQHVCQTVRVPL